MTAEIEEEGGTLEPEKRPPRVPNGVYQVRYEYYETRPSFGMGRPKVFITFSVITPVEYRGTLLQKFYNVERIKEPRRGGGFVPPYNGDLMRNMDRLFGAPTRRDRLVIGGNFRTRDWDVLVREVTFDAKKRSLPEASRYSVIDEVIGPVPQSQPRRTNPSLSPMPNPTPPVLDEIPF